MPKRTHDDQRSAAGLDFDLPLRDRAARLGQILAEQGPQAALDEIEELIPEPLRQQISNFPMAAVALGVGVGVWLGLRKGDEVIAAGASLLSAAAGANVASAFDRD